MPGREVCFSTADSALFSLFLRNFSSCMLSGSIVLLVRSFLFDVAQGLKPKTLNLKKYSYIRWQKLFF